MKFRRQHPIAGYILDFYCHQLKLTVEIDGGYHINKEQKDKDAERTSYLNNVGITEYRFTNEDILYPISKSYMKYKAKNKDKSWLSYL